MGEKTGISWTTSSWNPWIGCTEVSPGCDNCYARTLDKRHRWGLKPGDGSLGIAPHWGAGIPRYRTGAANWRAPLSWNQKAEMNGLRWTVFPSLCDPFDNEVPEEWRLDLFRLIDATPNLTWLLLTKRIGNAAKMLLDAWPAFKPAPNIWIGASVVNQEEADRDIPKLLETPAAKRFVSYEPALGPVNFTQIKVKEERERHDGRWTLISDALTGFRATSPYSGVTGPHLDWIIVGGESSQGGAKARPFDLAWARQTVQQCKAAGVPVFVKQMGSNAHDGVDGRSTRPAGFKDRAGADPAEWPEDLRVQEFPA